MCPNLITRMHPLLAIAESQCNCTKVQCAGFYTALAPTISVFHLLSKVQDLQQMGVLYSFGLPRNTRPPNCNYLGVWLPIIATLECGSAAVLGAVAQTWTTLLVTVVKGLAGAPWTLHFSKLCAMELTGLNNFSRSIADADFRDL